jgi:hypothetical protein
MVVVDKNENPDQLLVDIFTDRLGFNNLPTNIPPIYLYTLAFVFIDFGIVNTYFHLATARTHGFIQNPFSFAIPASVIIAAIGIRYMAINMRDALDQMNLEDRSEFSNDDEYNAFSFSFQSKIMLYVLILGGYYANIFIIIGLPSYLEEFGVVSTVAFAVIIYPLGYIPIAVEFFMLFASIHVLLPRQIVNARPTPAFLDPRNLGGFYPIGELLKHSYYIYTVGLLLFLSYIYGPSATGLGTAGISRAGAPEAAFFTIIWSFGLLAVGFSMLTIHRLMAREKESHLSQLEVQLHDLVDEPYNISSATLNDSPEVEEIQQRIEYVRTMRVYPTTASTSAHLIVSILIPEVMNLILQAV